MIGANMGFSRVVLSKVPRFDPELGPGALGFGDDTLFSLQVEQAGFTIVSALDIEVEHWPVESRLTRTAWLRQAADRGRSLAYIDYHWRHREIPRVEIKYLRVLLSLAKHWLVNCRNWLNQEGCPEWEMQLYRKLHYYRYYLKLQVTPRAYAKHGLRKLVDDASRVPV